MLQIILPVIFLLFGFFLKKTTLEGFKSSKRFANMFIILGISTLVAKFILMYLQCVRGAGSVTTAMRVPVSPRAALQRPLRCPGTAGVVVQGARVGLWLRCWLLIYHGEGY